MLLWDGILIVVMIVHEFVEGFSGMTIWVMSVCVLAGFLLRPSFATLPGVDVLVLREVVVVELVQMCLHSDVKWKEISDKLSMELF